MSLSLNESMAASMHSFAPSRYCFIDPVASQMNATLAVFFFFDSCFPSSFSFFTSSGASSFASCLVSSSFTTASVSRSIMFQSSPSVGIVVIAAAWSLRGRYVWLLSASSLSVDFSSVAAGPTQPPRSRRVPGAQYGAFYKSRDAVLSTRWTSRQR